MGRPFGSGFLEYVVRVRWSDGTVNVVYRRYSRFFSLQSRILDKHPKLAGVYDPADRLIPFLPGKIFFGRSQIRSVALERKERINEYCKSLIKLPDFISESKDVLNFFEPTEDDLKPNHDQIMKAEEFSGESISEPEVLEQYYVIEDYQKDGRNETSLQAGSVVEVVEKNETGWWFVNSGHGQGWVPSSYLEKPDGEDDRIIPAQASRGNKYIATHDYEASDEDEISLKKGGYVLVLEKNFDGWWLVRYQNREGRAPSTYLSAIDTLKARRLLKRSKKASARESKSSETSSNMSDVRRKAKENIKTNSSNAHLSRFSHQLPSQKSQNGQAVRANERAFSPVSETRRLNGQNEAVSAQFKSKLEQFQNVARKTEFDDRRVKSPVRHNPRPVQPLKPQSIPQNSRSNTHESATQAKCDYENANEWVSPQDITKQPIKNLPQTEEFGEDYENVEEWTMQHNGQDILAEQINSNESLASIGSSSSDDSPTNYKIPPRRKGLSNSLSRTSGTFDNAFATRANLGKTPEDVYRAVQSYANTAGDGIDLVHGETLQVLEKTDVGWWYVQGVHGVGWAPESFIEKVKQPAAQPKQAPKRPPPPKRTTQTSDTYDEPIAVQSLANVSRFNAQLNREIPSTQAKPGIIASHSGEHFVQSGKPSSKPKPLILHKSPDMQRAHDQILKSLKENHVTSSNAKMQQSCNSNSSQSKTTHQSKSVHVPKQNGNYENEGVITSIAANKKELPFSEKKTNDMHQNQGLTRPEPGNLKSSLNRTKQSGFGTNTASQSSKPSLPSKPKPNPPPKVLRQAGQVSQFNGGVAAGPTNESRVNRVKQLFEK